jgi:hypothetical protein
MNEDEFKKILENKEDANKEPIFTMPLIVPLLKQTESYYFGSLTKSFSIGNTLQTKIADMIDKPKWNEITFMTQLHETMASKLGVLRSKDVCKHIFEYNKWDVLNDENQIKINDCITAFKSSKSNHHEVIISPVNASLFFTLLFVNTELNSLLDIDKKLVIANALTFATWKERMECDILLHKDLSDIFRKTIQYKNNKADHTLTFSNFCSIQKDVSKNTISNTLHILEISPWAGLDDVLNIVNEVMQIDGNNIFRQKGKGDRLLRDIILHIRKSETHNIYSIEKRRCEDQWFLIEILSILIPTDPKLKQLTLEIEQLTHANVSIDTHANIGEYIEFMERLKENPKIHAQLKKASDEIQEYASTIVTGIISKTGEKLIQKSVNYFIFLPFIIQIFREWRNHGFFASLQYTLDYTFKNISGRLFPFFQRRLPQSVS